MSGLIFKHYSRFKYRYKSNEVILDYKVIDNGPIQLQNIRLHCWLLQQGGHLPHLAILAGSIRQVRSLLHANSSHLYRNPFRICCLFPTYHRPLLLFQSQAQNQQQL